MGLDHGICMKKKGKGRNKYTELAYFRKCNQIHGWFLKHCIAREYGEPRDWNGDMFPITREDLVKLHTELKFILEHCTLRPGIVRNGYTYKELFGKKRRINNYEWGKKIRNKKLAKEFFPTTEGFFFGSYEYDELYRDQLEETEKDIAKILKEVDFDKYNVYYWGWW